MKPIEVSKINFAKPFIKGKFVSGSNSKRNLIAPHNRKTICAVEESTTVQVEEAVSAAKKALNWGDSYYRRDILNRIASLIDQNNEQLAVLETMQVGKPIEDSRAEMKEISNVFNFYAGFCDKIFGRSSNLQEGFVGRTIRQPVGVCGIITSYNYPLMLTCWKLAPALACGNTVLIKPHENTPLSALRLAQIVHENTDIPPGVLNILPGDGKIGQAISSHPNIDKCSFTGSGNVGKHVLKASAESNFKTVTLELGGKNPLIVFHDANIDETVENIVSAAFTNSGQNCCAGSRLLIHESVYNEVLHKLQERVQRIKILFDPFNEEDEFGPLINENQLKKTVAFIERAKNSGKKILTGGNEIKSVEGFYLEPTVFYDVNDDDEIAGEEIFGPVLSVVKPFKTIEEAVTRANNTVYGLAAGVFTKNIDTLSYIENKLEAGTIWVNCYNYTFPQMPFGGMKQSGIGYDLGSEAVMQEYTKSKAIVLKNK